jgi:adenylosuccinate synthase
MMKADVLADFEKIKIATAYKLNSGEVINYLPYDLETVTGVEFDEMEGWAKEELESSSNKNNLPKSLKKYISYIEEKTKLPVSIISLGPNREQTIILK